MGLARDRLARIERVDTATEIRRAPGLTCRSILGRGGRGGHDAGAQTIGQLRRADDGSAVIPQADEIIVLDAAGVIQHVDCTPDGNEKHAQAALAFTAPSVIDRDFRVLPNASFHNDIVINR